VAITVRDVTEKIVAVGVTGADPWKGSVEVAAEHLARHHDVGQAINKLIATHVRLAGAGFIAGGGGLMTFLVAIPADLTGLCKAHGRMAGAIARLPITAPDRRLQTSAAPSFAVTQETTAESTETPTRLCLRRRALRHFEARPRDTSTTY